MNAYEECKQLKDAGFPQKSTTLHSYFFLVDEKDRYTVYAPEDKIDKSRGEHIKWPSFHELIGECGKNFHTLTNGRRSVYNTWTVSNADGSIKTEEASAFTALVKFWLILKDEKKLET